MFWWLEDSWSLFKLKRIWKNPNSLKIYDEWIQLAVFVRQDWITSKQLIMCLDWSENLIQQVHAFLPKIHNGDPYAWQALFVSELKKMYDQAIWDLRGVVWDIEAVCDQRFIWRWDYWLYDLLQYQQDLEAFRPQFILLHDLARHISHSKEILDVALETVDSITHQYSLIHDYPCPNSSIRWHPRDIERQLYFTVKSLLSTKFRCVSLSERLQNEINLVYLVARFVCWCPTDIG